MTRSLSCHAVCTLVVQSSVSSASYRCHLPNSGPPKKGKRTDILDRYANLHAASNFSYRNIIVKYDQESCHVHMTKREKRQRDYGLPLGSDMSSLLSWNTLRRSGLVGDVVAAGPARWLIPPVPVPVPDPGTGGTGGLLRCGLAEM